jgi:plastocyanin
LAYTHNFHYGRAGNSTTMPQVTRTGEVQNIIIRDDLNPAKVSVQPGDEVRWINRRNGPIKIILLDSIAQKIACERGFGVLMNRDNIANLGPNESASICFTQPGTLTYTVRMDSSLPVGELNAPGEIVVHEAKTASSP